MKAIFTIGVSGSGKSTWASKQHGYRVIDRDAIRRRVLKQKDPDYRRGRENMWSFWDWNWEDEVDKLELNQVTHHIMMNEDVIICETGLSSVNPKEYIQKVHDMLKAAGYDISYHYCKIELSDAIQRDRKRVDRVGDHVIYEQWLKWLALPAEHTGIRKYEKDVKKPVCIVCDIDGTLAYNRDRKPYDWSKVLDDEPIEEIITLVKMYKKSDYSIVFLTGRSDACEDDTRKWLKKYVTDDFELHMRKEGDYSKDRVIKEQMFFEKVAPNYNVELVIDDRKQVVNLWTDIGVKLLNVGNIYESF